MIALVVAACLALQPAPDAAPATSAGAPEAPAPAAPAPAVVDAPAPSAPADAPEVRADAPDAREKLLVLDVKSADLSKEQVGALTSSIAARAHRFSQVQATSSQDLLELAELEAEKQQAGCEGDSCLAELADALGARYVLATRAGKIGSATVVSVQLYDAKQGTVMARDTAEVFALDEMPLKVAELVDRVLTQALGAPVEGAAPLPQAPPPSGPDALHMGLRIGGGVGVALGVVSASLGLVPFALYQQKKGALLDAQRAYDGSADARDAAAALRREAVNARGLYNGPGRVALIGGVTLVALGAGALAAGFLLPPLDELGAAAEGK